MKRKNKIATESDLWAVSEMNDTISQRELSETQMLKRKRIMEKVSSIY